MSVSGAAPSGVSCSHAFLASSKRAILSGVKLRQRKSGGLGKVEEMDCVWSAMSLQACVL